MNLTESSLFTAAYLLIAVGTIAFIIGFLGCKGSYSENTCMLGWVGANLQDPLIQF